MTEESVPTGPIRRIEEDPAFTTEDETDTNILAELQKDVQAEIPKGTFVLTVPARPNVSIRYSDFIDGEMFNRWLKKCSDRQGNVDALKFARIIIANQAIEVMQRGRVAYGNDGLPYNFGHDEFISMLNAVDTASAIEQLFGEGPDVMATSQVILDECGYGQRSNIDLDPMRDSSKR